MPRMRRLLAILLAVACSLVCSGPGPLAKTLNQGDLITFGIPFANTSQLLVMRIVPTTGLVDTVLVLPSGVTGRSLAVSPQDCLIYLLQNNVIHRLDPCTGHITSLPTGLAGLQSYSDIVVHSNGWLYWTQATGGVVRTDRNSGASSALTNVFTAHAATPTGIVEGKDQQLYIATAAGSNGTLQPWAVKVDPNSGASSVHVRFNEVNSNVRELAFDSRDSLAIYRGGFQHAIYRTDPVAQLASQLYLLPVNNSGGAAYGISGHPDGGLYFIPINATAQTAGISRLDPVTQAVSTIVPQQNTWSFFGLALVKTQSQCPSSGVRSTWGKVKALYR